MTGVTEESYAGQGNEGPPTDGASNGSTASAKRYSGTVLGIPAKPLVDVLHFMSAGAVSFARGLNDTPKIAGILLIAGGMGSNAKLVMIAVAMALGGLISSRRVAQTMSHKLTDMNPGQGLAANLTTALLVTTASLSALPVSTTHVSVGALLGMGTVSGQAKWKSVIPVLASWVITLPCAALLASLFYFLFSRTLG